MFNHLIFPPFGVVINKAMRDIDIWGFVNMRFVSLEAMLRSVASATLDLGRRSSFLQQPAVNMETHN